MAERSRTGPPGARWVLAALGMIAAVLIGMVQPAGDAAAQGTFGGGNLTIVSLATTANPASRDVGLLWNIGAAPGGYSLNRVTTNASGNATIAIPNPPGVLGTQNFFVDTVPASAGNAACYRLIPLNANGTAAGSSDMMCIIFAVAQGTVPVNARAELDQGSNLKVSWDPTPGATSFIVWGVGTDGVQGAVAAPVTLPGNGGLICAVVLSLNANGAIIGASNILCGFPGFFSNVSGGSLATPTSIPPTATRTNTPGSLTPTNTTVALTSTSTATPVPSATVTQTATSTTTNTPTITLTPAPVDLLIVKSGNPNPANAGGTATFSLLINNIGGTNAVGITVQDNLPAGLTFLSAADASNPNRGFVCGAAGSVVACTGGTLAPGQSATIQIVVLIDNPCVVTSPISNNAVVNPNNTIPESSTANNSSTFSLTVIGCAQATQTQTRTPTRTATSTATTTGTITTTPTLTATPGVDLTIAKFGSPDPISDTSGTVLTYTLAVGNAGPNSVSNVTVQDTLPAQVTYLSSAGDNGFICTPNAGPPATVTCTGGTLGGNGGAVITIVVQRNATACVAGAFTNTAVVDPGLVIPESNENNNTATFTDTCGVGANTVTPAPATNTLTRTATLTPTQTNTATAIPGFATGTTTATPGFAFLKLSSNGSVNPGQTFTYTLQLVNQSGATISGIQLTDPLPVQVSFISVSADHGIVCGNAGNTVACDQGSIPSGETANITINVLAAASCLSSPIINTATLTQPLVTNNTATNTTQFDACATQTPSLTATPTNTQTPTQTATPTNTAIPTFDLSIVKTQTTANPVLGGQTLTYSVVVTNTGPTGTANGVSFIDNAPSTVSYTGVSATPGAPTGGATNPTCTVGGGNVITCTGATIPVGGTITVTVSGTVTFAACNTTLSNTATLIDPADLNSANNTSTVTTPIVCANLDVAFTDLSPLGGNFAESQSAFDWNSSARYTLTNNSPTAITNVSYVVTMQSSPISMPSGGIGQVTTNPGGWTCTFTSGSATSNTYTCTGPLAASGSVVLDFSTGFTGPGSNGSATQAGAVTWTETVTCTGPAPCTSGTASPANSDGSVLTPTDTDSIFASDLDITFTDAGGGENLSIGVGTIVSTAEYLLFNDGPVAITGVTFAGTITGSATRQSANVAIANGSSGPWSCTTTVNSWSCTGNLAADSAYPAGNNAPGAGTADQVTLDVQVTITGPVIGQTVTFTPNGTSCTTPGACTNNVVSPANMDGSTTVPAADTDTIVA